MNKTAEYLPTAPAVSLPSPSIPFIGKLTQERFDAIIDAVAAGIGTAKAVEANGVNRSTFYALLAKSTEAVNRYARAKEAAVHAIVDEAMEIQDERPPLIQTKFGTQMDAAFVAW